MNKRYFLIAAGLTTLGALAGFGVKALADGIPSPNPLYYSGTLTESGGLVDGTRAITVNLWPDATTAGSPLCQTVASTTQVTSGRFRIALDSSCKTAINQNNNAYVEVIDGSTSLGRSPIGAVPYAVEADHAVSANSATSATTAAIAAYASDAGHAGTADNATSAQTATLAKTASALAAGPISTGLTVFTMNGQVVAPCAVASGFTGVVDCTCPTGTFAVAAGGGANSASGQFLREDRPTSATTWRVTCSTATADVLCYSYNLTCSRLGP